MMKPLKFGTIAIALSMQNSVANAAQYTDNYSFSSSYCFSGNNICSYNNITPLSTYIDAFDRSRGNLRGIQFNIAIDLRNKTSWDGSHLVSGSADMNDIFYVGETKIQSTEYFIDPVANVPDQTFDLSIPTEIYYLHQVYYVAGESGNYDFKSIYNFHYSTNERVTLLGFSSLDRIGYFSDYLGSFNQSFNACCGAFWSSTLSVSTGVGVTFDYGVPEPASWVMLIVGFGMTGTMLRRRRTELAA